MAGTSEAAYGQHYADWKDWGAAGFGEADASTRAYFDGELRRAGLLPLAGKRVLEIGFGNGAFLAHAHSAGAAVSGTEAIDVLVERARAAGIDAHAVMDLAPFDDASFDAVVMFDVLEHIPQAELPAVLAGIRRKLKPGGTLIARFPNGDSPLSLAVQNGDPTHITYLGSEKIRFLLRQAGLEPSFVGPPAPVLNDPNLKRRMLKWGQLLPRKAIERTVKLLFFPNHEIHFFSSNLVINAVAPAPGGLRSDP